METTSLKTWIEINKTAIGKNIKTFRKLISPRVQLWSVVKSNAYGHSLEDFSVFAASQDIDGFCVDSAIEGQKLRAGGIQKPILVLGTTLPQLYALAQKNDITVSISTFESLKSLKLEKKIPKFHIKIDTGMHRQGFYPENTERVMNFIKTRGFLPFLSGVFTHFASAKDINYPTYTDLQFSRFQKAIKTIKKYKKDFVAHAAATGGAMINAKYHLDAVRIGIGLYGLWPSKELEIQLGKDIHLSPVLSWKSRISEIKSAKRGVYTGYDLTERLSKNTKIAVVPIGYWHGFDRGLSACGEVLIRGKRCRVLGRVSMDMIVVDIQNFTFRINDEVILIGKSKSEEITATEMAQKIGTTHYEIVTRINPLIKRIMN